MLIDKNTKQAISENIEIKRIMSEGGYCGIRKLYTILISF